MTRVHANDQRIRALIATTIEDDNAYTSHAVIYIRAQGTWRHIIDSGEKIDCEDGYHRVGVNDKLTTHLTSELRLARFNASWSKFSKSLCGISLNLPFQEDPELLCTPSTAKEALASQERANPKGDLMTLMSHSLPLRLDSNRGERFSTFCSRGAIFGDLVTLATSVAGTCRLFLKPLAGGDQQTFSVKR